MNRKIICILSLLFLGYSAMAQALYKEGFVLKSPLDTLYGQVKYVSYNQAAKRCIIRVQDGSEQSFLPGEIYGYGIEQELLFISKELPKSGKRFAEVLYQGTVTLYAFRDANQRNFFYLENPELGELRALTQKTMTRGRKRQVLKSYIDVLKIMLPENELVADEIEKVPLTAKGLNNLLVAYDERYAQTKGISYLGFKTKSPTQISVLAGASLSGLTLNGHDGRETSQAVIAGVRIEKEVSRNTGRLFIHADLLVTREKYSGRYNANQLINTGDDVVTNNINITLPASFVGLLGQIEYNTRVELDRTLINLPIGLKYKIPGRKFNVTFGGGLEFQFATSDDVLVDGQILQNEIIEVGVLSREDANPFRVGMNIGMGISYNARRTLFLDLRHSPSFFDQGSLNYDYTRLMLGVMLSKN